MPKVSVIVPIYEAESYIKRCAKSLFEQTLNDLEYLFIDDCSPDNSISVLESVLDEYPRRKEQTRIFRMSKNRGQAYARIFGIKEAKGEFTIHCDADDWVDADMYEQMYAAAKRESAEIVICDFTITDGKHAFHKKSCFNTKKDYLIRDLCSMQTSWSLCNKLVKTDLLCEGILLPQDNMGEDMAIIMQVVLMANRFTYIPRGFYYYFSNPNSITRVKDNECILARFLQVYNNSKIVLTILSRKGLLAKYKWPLCVLKLNVKRQAYILINNKEYAGKWKEVFPELNHEIWFCRYISLKEKMKYLYNLLRITKVLNGK